MTELKEVRTDKQIEDTANIAEGIWKEHFTPIIGAEQVRYMLNNFQSKESIKRQIVSEGYTYLNAFVNGKLVGYTGFKRDENRMFLSKLYLKKEYRGRGIARLMVNEIIRRSEGLDGIYLTVNKHNYETVAIYQHMGFKEIDKVVTNIGCGFVMDDFVMELFLK